MSLVDAYTGPRIAVVLPCYNEGGAIGQVVRDFREALPHADIYVFDNNSTDGTVAEAREAGAIIRTERRQGKGHVVRRMFTDVDADLYLMADGDGTYEAAAAPKMVALMLAEQLDMVVGTRVSVEGHDTYRPGHGFGNFVLTSILRLFFGQGFTDILSGYRLFSRRFVKSFPVLAAGFEIETEITTHALTMGLACGETETAYSERLGDTTSKLNTYRDGVRILFTMIRLFKDFRPMVFFVGAGMATILTAFVLAIPVVETFVEQGIVDRIPTAVLCTGMVISGMLSIACGFILDSVARQRLELKKLHYLSLSAVGGAPGEHTHLHDVAHG